MKISKSEQMIGNRYGRFVVKGIADPGAWRQPRVLALCDCGTSTIVRARALRTGASKSCGCLTVDVATKHGMRKTRTYASWRAMITRTTNEKNKNFANYGACGIAVCDRWRDSFEAFLADMGERPIGKTLDRFPDRDGNYEPDNCRWATPREQNRNRRSTRLTIEQADLVPLLREKGETNASIADRFGVPRTVIAQTAWRHKHAR